MLADLRKHGSQEERDSNHLPAPNIGIVSRRGSSKYSCAIFPQPIAWSGSKIARSIACNVRSKTPVDTKRHHRLLMLPTSTPYSPFVKRRLLVRVKSQRTEKTSWRWRKLDKPQSQKTYPVALIDQSGGNGKIQSSSLFVLQVLAESRFTYIGVISVLEVARGAARFELTSDEFRT